MVDRCLKLASSELGCELRRATGGDEASASATATR
jgi:hypothetical protein